jgi:hypothetical protein
MTHNQNKTNKLIFIETHHHIADRRNRWQCRQAGQARKPRFPAA